MLGEILKEETNEEKELINILRDAEILHEDLRNYGNLIDIDKPLIVAGILFSIKRVWKRNFKIDDLLLGYTIETDMDKKYLKL